MKEAGSGVSRDPHYIHDVVLTLVKSSTLTISYMDQRRDAIEACLLTDH